MFQQPQGLSYHQSPLFQGIRFGQQLEIAGMEWIQLTNDTQLDEIRDKSKIKPQVIFKHSTRCGISSMAFNRLVRSYKPINADFYLLDLISFRSLSNQVARYFHVSHESPQVLVIADEKCVYNESHSGINMDDIVAYTEVHKA